VLRPHERVHACLAALKPHWDSPAFLAFGDRARRKLFSKRRPDHASVIADRREVLAALGVDARLFPDEHPLLGVSVDLRHLRKAHVRFSFGGARVSGTARSKVITDCTWVCAEFRDVRFALCRFVGCRTEFVGATLATGSVPVHTHGCTFEARGRGDAAGVLGGATATASLRSRGLPCAS
jgi:hypothetical protein